MKTIVPVKWMLRVLKCHKQARHSQSNLRYPQDCHQNGSITLHQTATDNMIADVFTKALPRRAHERHKGTTTSDLPKAIVDMILSADANETPENRVVKKEDCQLTFEGLPEFERSPI